MKEILDMIGTPVWWVTVVVAGIVVSIVASYLRDFLDNWLSRVSAWWRGKSEKAKEEERRYVVKLQESQSYFSLYVIICLNLRTWAVMWMVIGSTCYTGALVATGAPVAAQFWMFSVHNALMALGSISFVMAFKNIFKSIKLLGYAERAIESEGE